MRLLEVIQRSSEFLEKRGVESPRLQVELMLARVLQVPRLQLYLQFERELGEPELAAMREHVRRRGNREPLQHILGTAVFCGLELEVSRAVLTPRPETELLAERCWQWAREREHAIGRAPRVLDWGTGSGCLAIAIAVNAPRAEVVALDVSEEALAVARRNAERHQVTARVQFHRGDGLSALPDGAPPMDLIVSNPPYIPTAEIEGLEPEVRDYDPRLALDGGADGLEFHRRLAVEAPRRLVPDGWLAVEHGDGQADSISTLLGDAGWIVAERHQDYSGRGRFLLARRDPDPSKDQAASR